MRRIAVRAIALKHDGKLLCTKLKPYNEFVAKMNDAWCLPGGGIDDYESLINGIEREIFEETGIKPKIGNLLYIQQFRTESTDHLEFFFHVTNTDDFENIDLSKTTHGADEIEKVEFVDPKSTPILPEFLTTENLIEKVSSNSPPTIFSFYN